MRERNQILKLWDELAATDESAVLATVVLTEGSSYRLPGARLLLAPDGRHAGGVSGGCLEEDILKKAWWLTTSGPVLRRYDTTADGEISTEGYGLGCNGIIHVLLERVSGYEPSVLPLLREVSRRRLPATVAHVLSSPATGRRLIVDPNGTVRHNVADPALLQLLLAEVGHADDSKTLTTDSGERIFLERLTPPVKLLVFGAGDDAVPLTQLARCLGWQVEVFDGRAHYARRDKFPDADQVTVRAVGSPAPPIDQWTVAVVMTHSYTQDLDVLGSLVGEPLSYLGVLGPRKRTVQLLADLAASGITAPSSLHTPMGLDLGGDGPEQVALAAVAEIQAVLHRRSSGPLRDRDAPIHSEGAHSAAEAWARSIVCA
ncbi:MAG: XdhC family protein [Acidobacteriota bacterium]|nr:XdhC family protein [Acidobacteriota bacterium]